MTDAEGGRPSWPAPRPTWDASAQQPAQPPPAPADTAPAPGKRSVWRWQLDLKLVIAVLIGAVSVTGAVMTWRSAQLGEYATDQDRLSVAETVTERENAANDELALQDARRLAAAAVSSTISARALDEQAATFRAAGDEDAAQRSESAADEERLIAQGYLSSFNAGLALADYLIDDAGLVTLEAVGENGPARLDERRLSSDLFALSASRSQVDSGVTARVADDLRDQSQRFDGWRIMLAVAIVLLTLAQVNRWRPARLGLAGLATSVWIVSSVLAFSGR